MESYNVYFGYFLFCINLYNLYSMGFVLFVFNNLDILNVKLIMNS